MVRAAALTVGVLFALYSATAEAQARPQPVAAGPARAIEAPAFPPRSLPMPSPGYGNPDHAFLASLALPGAGQVMLGQARWVPYVAVESWGWFRFVERRSTASRLAERYRDLAWTAAREATGVQRRDTTFAYYELLTKAMRSGAFDTSPADGLQPEEDISTYNGEQWRLARALFIPLGSAGTPGTPGYDAAIAYYMQSAIPEAYAFAWTSVSERERFATLIEDSDHAYSASTIILGLIIANHLTSSIDALITSRLRRGGRDIRFESGIVPEEQGDSWRAPLRLDTAIRYSW